MHLTSSSAASPLRSSPDKAGPGGLRARIRCATQTMRAVWRSVETFLVDYYRVCGIIPAPAKTMNPRNLQLRAGELFTFAAPRCSQALEVVRGEIWLTQTPADTDLLLGVGARFDLSDAQVFPVVIEALEEAEIVLRSNVSGNA